ncbi:MAG: YARHG domain-containing protein, partial [Calditrichales bacterium]|nr:YARHG domain-containing protein [Calditrichales bacterium]
MNTFKFFIYFVLLVLTLYSCNKEKEDAPLYDSAKNTNNSKASKIDASYLFDDNNYLIKGSDNIALFNFKEKLQTKSRNFLRLARNEIFARNGYIFKDSSLSFFFQSTGWYKPVSNFNPTNLSP